MEDKEELPVSVDQLRKAQAILKKYKNPNFRALLEQATDEEKPIISQVLEDLKDKDKKNSYWEWVGAIADDDFEDVREKQRKRGSASKDDKDLLALAEKLLGGKSQMLMKYNDFPEFEVLKDEDKATYRINPETNEFTKIKDAVKDSPFKDPNYEVNKALSEIDTNDNGEIEVDEMEDFQKSLDDYTKKNPKGREDIPATYKR